MRRPPLPSLILFSLLSAAVLASVGAAAPCPSTASLTIVTDNQSADPTVQVTVTGHILDATASCDDGATTYAETVTCGTGASRCARLTGLRPGVWAHTIVTQVTGSDEQVQTQRVGVLADAPGVSNVVEWTVYPRTFQVSQLDGTHLLAQFTAAQAYTAGHPGAHALVSFDREVFPGAAQPRVINVKFTPGPPNSCVPQQVCSDGRGTTYCFGGSRVVVDALDAEGNRGAVALRTGTCERSLMRILGSDNVFRGLEFRGSERPDSPIPVDTIALTGASARRNRLEHCIVRGPTRGDAISIEEGAGAPGGPGFENVVFETEVSDAEDKGIKITSQAHGAIVESCVHDNRNGGIQSTLGGNVVVVRNVVQRNAPGSAQNGLSVGVPENTVSRSSMVTDGNIVRFAGARGLSVVNTGDGLFNHDVVSDNQAAGVRVETTRAGVQPEAVFRGVAFACNQKTVIGTCFGEPARSCVRHGDCTLGQCVGFVVPVDGFGAVVSVTVKPSPAPGECPDQQSCLPPLVDFGPTAGEPGRNAFTMNGNIGSTTPGVNFNNGLPAGEVILARGNQWEHCGDESLCDAAAVEAADLRPIADPPVVTIGTPTGHRGGPPPAIARVSRARPRRGDLVRVYNGSLDGNGGTFNAIDGIACVASGTSGGLPAGIPSDICSAENPNIVSQNRVLTRGNRVVLNIGGEEHDADIHAVTPTMLAFRMPVDCWAAGTIMVARGQLAESEPVALCDAGGCAEREAGDLCDDGSACTVDERCTEDGACAATAPLDCSGACRTGVCDPATGCVLQPATAPCEDGNACTVDDRCAGDSAACEPGTAVTCSGACLTGSCDPASGCTPSPAGTTCDDGNACTAGDQCNGTEGTCAPGTPISCDDGNPCTADACDPASGCSHTPLADGTACAASTACGGTSLCRGGTCDQGEATACVDADFCTVDTCSPTQGCQHTIAVGTNRVRCRMDEIRFILSTAPGGGGSMSASIGRRVAKVEAALVRAAAATSNKAAKRELRKAKGALRGVVSQVRRARKTLGLVLERQLRRSAGEALDALNGLRPPLAS